MAESLEKNVKNEPFIGIGIASFVLAALVVLALFATVMVVTKLAGAPEPLGAALGMFNFTAIQYLHKRIEVAWRRKRRMSVADIKHPTISTARMLLYAPLMVYGLYGGLFVFGLVEALSLRAIFGEKLSDFDLLLINMLTGLVLSVAIPTLMYLLGEWIGRSLDQVHKALAVVFVSALLAPLLIIATMALTMGTKFSALISEVIIPLGIPILEHVPGQVLVYLLVLALSLLVPMSVGAVRGAKYKEFFDLAFFAKRLGTSERKDIDDFVTMIQRDYAQKLSPGGRGA